MKCLSSPMRFMEWYAHNESRLNNLEVWETQSSICTWDLAQEKEVFWVLEPSCVTKLQGHAGKET